MKRLILISAILSIALNTLFAKTWVVDTTGKEGDSLQLAIDSAWANPGIDTVLVKNGTYHLFINDTVGLIMRDSAVLISENGAQKCTLTAASEDGTDTAWHVIYCNGWDTASHAALIKGFTIKDGGAWGASPHDRGGGIYIDSASPTIDSCIITNNFAWASGAGIYIHDHSSPILSGNTITDNVGGVGGGIYIHVYSSPTLKGNTITNNSAALDGGGIHITDYSSPILIGNTITNNSADDGGGIYIHDHSSPTLEGNTITNNFADDDGGGIYISYSCSPTLSGNTITDNSANDEGGGISIRSFCSPTLSSNTIINNSANYGGGIFIWYYSSPTLECNTITNNSANWGGGIYIYDHSSPTLSGNTVTNNYANYGGGICIYKYCSAKLTKCVICMNKSKSGGAIYDTLNSKIIIDSSFIADNEGLAYIASDADSGVTFRLTQSHIYYNTFQPDTEINNLSSVTINLENNFWWDKTFSEISAKIKGNADFYPWLDGFILEGVPAEPVAVYSLKNYDRDFLTIIDSVGEGDTLYIKLTGYDRNPDLRELAIVILKSSVYPRGIAVGLVETDTNSGVYEGMAYVLESTGNDTIRIDDINQIIRVNPIGDEIILQSNIDTTKKFFVKYKGGPQPDIVLSDAVHDFGACSPYDTIDWKIWIKNAGNTNLVIDSVELEPPFAIVSPTLPETISAGDSSEFTIRFNPQDIGDFSDTMEIYSNDPDEPVAKVYLSGKALAPNIILSDTIHDFGICSPYDTIDWQMWVKNTGNETLSVDSVKVNLPFELISPSLPQIILPSDSTEFTIRFSPQDTGSFSDTMKIYSNDPDEPVAKVYLSGRAVIPDIVLSDTVHDFGSCSQYDTINWQMWVSNVGDADLVIDSVELEPPFELVSPSLPHTISPHDSIAFVIRFSPVDTGSLCDTMRIFSNDPDEPVAEVKLTAYVVGIQEILPQVFAVSQSYPNPFRDFTVIKYQLPQKEWVTIKILDITGRVVNTLVNEVEEPGYYSVVWRGRDINGRSLPSGIYFYVIKAGKNKALRKIIRLK